MIPKKGFCIFTKPNFPVFCSNIPSYNNYCIVYLLRKFYVRTLTSISETKCSTIVKTIILILLLLLIILPAPINYYTLWVYTVLIIFLFKYDKCRISNLCEH